MVAITSPIVAQLRIPIMIYCNLYFEYLSKKKAWMKDQISPPAIYIDPYTLLAAESKLNALVNGPIAAPKVV